MALELGSKGEGRSHTSVRAFRPIFIWAAVSGVLLTWDAYRRTSLFFNVSAEGQSLTADVSVSVNGQSHRSGSLCTPGSKKILVNAPDMEPFETNGFVWLGSNHFGDFRLIRSTGGLRVTCDPAADTIHVKGARFNHQAKGTVGEFRMVPVGQYEISAEFGGWTEKRTVEVQRNETEEVGFRPEIGWIEVGSTPTHAKMVLSVADGRNTGFASDTAGAARVVTAGKYKLAVTRGSYRKDLEVEIKRAETNHIHVTFEYGELKLASEPSGATILLNDKEAGQTPKTFSELQPGVYSVKLRQSGRQPAEVRVQVDGNKSITFTTNLVSVTYLDSMQRARRIAESSSPDFRGGLMLIEEALLAKPGDGEALDLQGKFREGLAKLEAKEAQARTEAELKRRRGSAEDEFLRTTEPVKDSGLFDTQVWQVKADLAKVREALVRSVAKAPVAWQVTDESTGDELRVIRLGGKGLLGKHRHATVLIAQITAEEVQVYAKFWDYALGNKISLNLFEGIAAESMVPVHPRYFKPDQAAMVEARRKAIAEEFKTKLFNELR